MLTAQTNASFVDEIVTTSALTNQTPLFSQAELEQMLAPIALYPDSLLTHILIASTYPLELVQLKRWLDKHKHIRAEDLLTKINKKDWDASVKALVAFPRVVNNLNDDLRWTQQLGDAFLSDEEQVLESIQRLRYQAEQAGNLAKMTNANISYEDNNIIIESSQPSVVYVPYYDPRVIYGTWHYRNNPPVYWTAPRHIHASHYTSHHYQPFYWNTGVHIAFDFFFSAFHWHNRHVVVVHRYHKPWRTGLYRHKNRTKIVTNSGAKRWRHKPHHRRGVAYSNTHIKKRFYSTKKVTSHGKYQPSHTRKYKNHRVRDNIPQSKKRSYVKKHLSKQQANNHYKNSTKNKKVVKKNGTKQVKQIAKQYENKQLHVQRFKRTSQSYKGVKRDTKMKKKPLYSKVGAHHNTRHKTRRDSSRSEKNTPLHRRKHH